MSDAEIECSAARLGIGLLGVALIDGPREREVLIAPPNARRSTPNSPRFHAASAGKHVTARVIYDWVAQGRLDLDGAIGDYLNDLPPAWRGRRLRSLLHHTSGLPEYLNGSPADVPSKAGDFLQLCATLPPCAPEGEGWRYSNTNYILLGLIAQAVGGRPCGKQMQDLLDRVGAGEARVATPTWTRAANAGECDPSGYDHDSLTRDVIGDGDVAFTPASALAWMRTFFNDSPWGGDFADLTAPAPLSNGALAPYGGGLFLDHRGASRLAYHAGHFDGWTAMMLLNLDSASGVFALCDLAPGNTRAIRAIALEALEDFAPGSTPLSLPPIVDSDPALSRQILDELLRPDSEPNLSAFAPSMQARPGARGVPNFWAGEPPATVKLVDTVQDTNRVTRRYRLQYADRTEHLSVGVVGGLIDWAWTL